MRKTNAPSHPRTPFSLTIESLEERQVLSSLGLLPTSIGALLSTPIAITNVNPTDTTSHHTTMPLASIVHGLHGLEGLLDSGLSLEDILAQAGSTTPATSGSGNAENQTSSGLGLQTLPLLGTQLKDDLGQGSPFGLGSGTPVGSGQTVQPSILAQSARNIVVSPVAPVVGQASGSEKATSDDLSRNLALLNNAITTISIAPEAIVLPETPGIAAPAALVGAGASTGGTANGGELLPGPGGDGQLQFVIANQRASLLMPDPGSFSPETSGLVEDATPFNLASIENALQHFLDQIGDVQENAGWMNSAGTWSWMLGATVVAAAVHEIVRRRLRHHQRGLFATEQLHAEAYGFLPGMDPFKDE